MVVEMTDSSAEMIEDQRTGIKMMKTGSICGDVIAPRRLRRNS
jgi:hypothetical protein